MRVSRDVYEQHCRRFPAGAVIFRERDPGSEMFVIIEGSVEISKSTSGGSSKTLIELGKGDIFGEMAVIEKKSRSATATAMAKTRLLVLDEGLFDKSLEGNPDFARKMIKVLSERLRRANLLLQNVLATGRQNQVLDALSEFAAGSGEKTFKGARVNVDRFVEWATAHIGLDDRDIRQAIDGFIRRKQLQTSARGADELIVPAPR